MLGTVPTFPQCVAGACFMLPKVCTVTTLQLGTPSFRTLKIRNFDGDQLHLGLEVATLVDASNRDNASSETPGKNVRSSPSGP